MYWCSSSLTTWATFLPSLCKGNSSVQIHIPLSAWLWLLKPDNFNLIILILIYRCDFLPFGAFPSHWAWVGNPQGKRVCGEGLHLALVRWQGENLGWRRERGIWISQQHLPHLLGPPGWKSTVCARRRRKTHWRDHWIFYVQSYCLPCEGSDVTHCGLLLICLFVLSSTIEVNAVRIVFI